MSYAMASRDYRNSQQRAARAERRGSILQWPPHVRTLLGTSADAPILALTRWMVAYPSHKYFSKYFDLLSEVLRICGRAAATTMFRCVHIPRALVDEIECTLAELPEPPTIGALQPIFAVLRWSRQTYAHPDEMSTAYFYGGESERLVGLIDSLIRLYPRISHIPGAGRIREDVHNPRTFMQDGGVVHSSLDLPYDTERYHHDLLTCSRATRARRVEENVYYRTYGLMIEQSNVDYCGFPPCKATFTGEGRRFRYCGSCKRIPYCSVECQKQHWRWERSAHRTLCKDFCYLRNQFELSSPRGRYCADRVTHNKDEVQALCVVKQINVAVIQRIAQHDKECKRISREVCGGSADATSYLNLLA